MILLSACSIYYNTDNISTANAQDRIIIDSSEHDYEFNLICDVFAEKNDSSGDLIEINLNCCIDISAIGTISYTLYSQDDFSYHSYEQCNFHMKTETFDSYFIVPYWYNWKDNKPNKEYNCFIKADNKRDLAFGFITGEYGKQNGYFCWETFGNSLSFNKGDILCKCIIKPNTDIHIDKTGKLYIIYEDTIKYLNDDVGLFVNDIYIHNLIGNRYNKQNCLIENYEYINNNCEYTMIDLISLNRYIIDNPIIMDSPLISPLDINRDFVLDSIDLCLMKHIMNGDD
jgi:hypothetical protein